MNFVVEVTRQSWFIPVLTTLVILALVPLLIGYLSLVERKLLADFQGRYGPMRVGPHGLLQPLADALKFLLKEDTIPAGSERVLFLLGPLVAVLTALVGFSVLPFTRNIFIADVNIAVLLVAGVSALSVLGIIIGGWASNSHYPLLGALRSTAQFISYEVALTLALLAGVMVSGTMSLRDIVTAQETRHIWFLFSNYGAMLVPFAVYVLASVAETNRSPFDLPEAESELVAGYHTEFSGFRFALYMLAEWANILVLSAVAVTLFLGGWLRPFPNTAILDIPLNAATPFAVFAGIGGYCVKLSRRTRFGFERLILLAVAAGSIAAGALFLIPVLRATLADLFWFCFKLSAFVYLMIWLRATLPRVRFDQLMKFGWKWLIPLALVGLALNALFGM
jgi:NADH-quinone oxidoreductase subunit H